MVRIIKAFVISFSVFFNCYGQSLKNISLGLTASPIINFSKFEDGNGVPDNIELRPRIMFIGGAVLNKRLNALVQIEAGIEVTSMGLRRRISDPNDKSFETQNIFTTSYTAAIVPIRLIYDLPTIGNKSLYLKGGLNLMVTKPSMFVGGKTRHTYNNVTYEETFMQDKSNSGYSINIGVGLKTMQRKSSFLALTLLCNTSFNPISSWNYHVSINGQQVYAGTIINKFTYFGIEVVYYFMLARTP